MIVPDAPIENQTVPEAAALPALAIGHVSHSYGPRRALIDVDFSVAPASFTAR